MGEFINSFSFEACLAHIFSFLDLKNRYNCESVCRHWRNISLQYWCNIKHVTIVGRSFSSRPYNAEDYFTNLFKRNSFSIKSLDLSNFNLKMDDNCLMLIGKNCKNLQNADFSGYTKEFSIKSIKYFVKNCSKLISLTFSNINDEGIRWIFYKCHFLEKFGVINNHKFEGSTFNMLPATLTHLCFEGSSMLKTSVLENLNRCINLKYLQFKECSKISTDVFQYIGKCTSLQVLIYSRTTFSMFPKDFEYLYNLSNLRQLTLKNFYNAEDNLSQIFCHCPIEYLDIGILSTFARNYKMEDLEFANHLKEFMHNNSCEIEITDDFLMNLTYCSNLKKLNILNSGSITNEGILNLINKCKHLTDVKLNNNYFLTNAISSKIIEIALINPNKEYNWIINGLAMQPLEDITLPNNLHLDFITLKNINEAPYGYDDCYSDDDFNIDDHLEHFNDPLYLENFNLS